MNDRGEEQLPTARDAASRFNELFATIRDCQDVTTGPGWEAVEELASMQDEEVADFMAIEYVAGHANCGLDTIFQVLVRHQECELRLSHTIVHALFRRIGEVKDVASCPDLSLLLLRVSKDEHFATCFARALASCSSPVLNDLKTVLSRCPIPVEKLFPLLHEEGLAEANRYEIERQIAVSNSPDLVDFVVAALESNRPDMWKSGLHISASHPIHVPAILKPLQRLLHRTDDPGIQAEVIRGLTQVPEFDPTRFLIWGLRHPAAQVRLAAAHQAWKWLSASSEASDLASAIIGCFQDDDPRVRSAALRSLAESESPTLWPLESLVEALKDPADEVRYQAVRLLGLSGNEQAFEYLAKVLDRDCSEVRRAAARALADLGNLRATELLINTLKARGGRVNQSAAIALGHFGDPKAIPFLMDAISDSMELINRSDSYVEKSEAQGMVDAVVTALARIDDQRALDGLFEVADRHGLHEKVATQLSVCRRQEAFWQLLRMYPSQDRSRGFEIALADLVGGETVLALLLDADVETCDLGKRIAPISCFHDTARESVRGLIQLLGSGDSRMRRTAAIALGNLGDSLAVNALGELEDDKDESVRVAVDDALKRILSNRVC